MEDLQNLLALAAVPNVGAARLQALIKAFGSSGRVFRANYSELVRVDGINEKIAREILKNQFQEDAAKHLENIKKSNINVLTVWDNHYPSLLKNLRYNFLHLKVLPLML